MAGYFLTTNKLRMRSLYNSQKHSLKSSFNLVILLFRIPQVYIKQRENLSLAEVMKTEFCRAIYLTSPLR